jgi:nitroimidazol reductase NimA-like FMN-containing flavoprotein (pyridoxamine 5'-phosphate oxidase superfamily)
VTAAAGRDRPDLASTERTRLGRMRERGTSDRAVLDEILAAGFLCHVGVVLDGHPMVVPTVYGATVDTLYFHGSVASPSLRDSPGTEVCVTVSHLDGIVLARSVFEHGINYRSAMIFGVPRRVTDPDELLSGLRCLTEQVARGQWGYARLPSRKELAATTLLALSLAEASVKVRTGPPDDGDSPDAALGRWAGVVPVRSVRGEPVPDPALPDTELPVPDHIRAIADRG